MISLVTLSRPDYYRGVSLPDYLTAVTAGREVGHTTVVFPACVPDTPAGRDNLLLPLSFQENLLRLTGVLSFFLVVK